MTEYSSLGPDVAAQLRAFTAGAEPWALIHGEALALLTHLPSACVDAVLTDSPYSSGGMHRGDRAKSTCTKYLKRGKHRPDFEGDTLGVPGLAIWDKTEATRPQKGRFRQQVELVAWGSKGPMPFDRIGGEVLPGVVRCAPRIDNKNGHQVGKPREVCRAMVKICEPGGLVLDPFAGGASFGQAALDERRRYLGFEVVQRIHADALRELQERVHATGSKAAKAAPLQELLFGEATR